MEGNADRESDKKAGKYHAKKLQGSGTPYIGLCYVGLGTYHAY